MHCRITGSHAGRAQCWALRVPSREFPRVFEDRFEWDVLTDSEATMFGGDSLTQLSKGVNSWARPAGSKES